MIARLFRRLLGYRCPECGRRCKSQRGLTLHRKVHAPICRCDGAVSPESNAYCHVHGVGNNGKEQAS